MTLHTLLAKYVPPLAIKGLFADASYDPAGHSIIFPDFHACELARTVWKRQIDAALPGVTLSVGAIPRPPTAALIDIGDKQRRAHIIATAAATLSKTQI